ncbi:HAD family hydrolase [Vibrio chagasii]|nr:HAD family hydrolase [Vibrio chagasii]
MIKTILLDMDETLCATSLADIEARDHLTRWLTSEYPEIKNPEEVSRKFLKGFYRELNDEYADAVSLLPDEGAFRLMLLKTIVQESGVELAKICDLERALDKFNEERMKAFDFFPNAKETIESLRADYKLVVITNGSTYSQHPKLERVAMHKLVNHVIVGGEEPEQKPSNSIFNKALSLTGSRAEECIHVGDSLTADINGANNAGITSVWVCRDGGANVTNIKPDHIIKCVTEVNQILDKLNN